MSGSGGGNRRVGEVRGYAPPNGKPLSIVVDTISPGYLKTLGIPLAQGREFARSDMQNSAPVLIVNQQFVTEYLKGRDPLGVQVRIDDVWRSIVGVHRNYVYRDPTQSQSPTVLLPMAQDYSTSAILILRTKGDPAQIVPDVRREIVTFDRNIPLSGFMTMEENVSAHFASDEMGTAALTIFALFAGLLAAIGIFAVLAAYVNQRRREFGIRIALGALPRDVRRRVLVESVRLAAIGSGIGLLLSIGLGKVFASSLLGLNPFDPRLYLATVLGIGSIVIISTLVPARNASRMDPVAALRSE
jgi:hypothetical protein